MRLTFRIARRQNPDSSLYCVRDGSHRQNQQGPRFQRRYRRTCPCPVFGRPICTSFIAPSTYTNSLEH